MAMRRATLYQQIARLQFVAHTFVAVYHSASEALGDVLKPMVDGLGLGLDIEKSVLGDEALNLVEIISFRAASQFGEGQLREEAAQKMCRALVAERGVPCDDFWKHYQESSNPVILYHAKQMREAERHSLMFDSLFGVGLVVLTLAKVAEKVRDWDAAPEVVKTACGDATVFKRLLDWGVHANLGLAAGAVGKAWQFFQERTKLTEDTAYEVICDLEDVIALNVGESASGRIRGKVEDAIQRARRNCGMEVWTREEMRALSPVVEQVVKHVANGEFGIPELVHAVGMLFDAKDVAGSLANVEQLHALGLEGIAKLRAAEHGVPTAKWAGDCGHACEHDKGPVAQYALLKTNAAHLGTP